AARRAAVRARRAGEQARARCRDEDRDHPRGRAAVALRACRPAISQPSVPASARIGRVTVRPYGTWPSPLDADTVAGIPAYAFASVSVAWPRVRWLEARPAEGGRLALLEWCDGGIRELTPEGFNVRTRVHEYGGGACWFHGETAFCSSFEDGRLHRVENGEATPLTPEPPEPSSLRYADGDVTPDGTLIVCVRECHEAGDVQNELVALPADGLLHFASDRDGWWNLQREDGALTSLEDGEIGSPGFIFGTSRYVFLGDGRTACVVTRAAV